MANRTAQEPVGFETERRVVWASNLKRSGHFDRLLGFGLADKLIKRGEKRVPTIGLAVALQNLLADMGSWEHWVWIWSG